MITEKDLEIKKNQVLFSCKEFLNNKITFFHYQILSIAFGHLDVAFELLTNYLQQKYSELEKHIFYQIIPGLLSMQITPNFYFYFFVANCISSDLKEKYFAVPTKKWTSIWQVGKSIIEYCNVHGYDMHTRKKIVNLINEILKLYDTLKDDFEGFVNFLMI